MSGGCNLQSEHLSDSFQAKKRRSTNASNVAADYYSPRTMKGGLSTTILVRRIASTRTPIRLFVVHSEETGCSEEAGFSEDAGCSEEAGCSEVEGCSEMLGCGR